MKIDKGIMIENQKLIFDLNKYENLITKLKNENKNLNKQLLEANQIISSYENIANNQQAYIDEINSLKEIIKIQKKKLDTFQVKLSKCKCKRLIDYDDIIVVNFISSDQYINCGIKCLETDTFAEVEEQLYQQYENYRNTNNNFIAKGRLVLRFKKICENGIKNGDKIQLINVQ